MKKLTVEQKAKAYDKALSVAKGLYAKDAPDSLHLERMFPELKESEDEKFINEIEKSLLAYKIIVMDNDKELANYIEKEINWLKSKCKLKY